LQRRRLDFLFRQRRYRFKGHIGNLCGRSFPFPPGKGCRFRRAGRNGRGRRRCFPLGLRGRLLGLCRRRRGRRRRRRLRCGLGLRRWLGRRGSRLSSRSRGGSFFHNWRHCLRKFRRNLSFRWRLFFGKIYRRFRGSIGFNTVNNTRSVMFFRCGFIIALRHIRRIFPLSAYIPACFIL